MRILYVITKSEIGGAQAHLIDVSKHFHSQGDKVLVVVGDRGWLTEKLREEGISFVVLEGLKNTYNPKNLIRLVAKLKTIIRDFNPEIIHGHSSVAGLISRLASIRTKAHSVFTMHGCPFATGYSLKHRVFTGLAELFSNAVSDTTVIYVSNTDLKTAERLGAAPLNESRRFLIYNGIEEVEERNRSSDGTLKVLMTARFDYPKDHTSVIEAASKLREYPYQFYFIGSGPKENSAKELVQKLGLKNVNFIGALSDAKKYLKDFDIFLLSSRAEGLPISILEAMSASLPIIATNVGGIPEIVVNDHNGFLVEPGNPDAIVVALKKLLNPDLIKTFGKNSRIIFEERFTKEKMLTQIENVYQALNNHIQSVS